MMKNLYFAIVLLCLMLVLICGFQNLVWGTPAIILTTTMNNGLLIFFIALIGFIAGNAFTLYIQAWQSQNNPAEEEEEKL